MHDEQSRPDVAERPDILIVYGGRASGPQRASFDAIVRDCARWKTRIVLVQSGKPVAVFAHTNTRACLIRIIWSAPGQLGKVHELDTAMMYGQMTGAVDLQRTQGIVQGTFEKSGDGRQTFWRRSCSKLIVSGGMGGMGGAQPLAATLNGAVFLGIDVDPVRIERRVRTGYCDRIATTLDEALDICEDARAEKRAVSVGLIGNCAEVLPELVRVA